MQIKKVCASPSLRKEGLGWLISTMSVINNQFKKIILSTTVISVFIVYVLVQRVQSIGLLFIKFLGEDDDDAKVRSSQISKLPTTNSMMSQQNQMMNNNSIIPNSGKNFKDGDFVGKITDAYYGQVQVKAVIHGGSIVDVQFMDHPHRYPTSIMINTYAMPILKTEAIKAQSANVDGVSGASFTSRAFLESLGDALEQAKN